MALPIYDAVATRQEGMMKHTGFMIRVLLALLCVAALARPDKLWSSVPPTLGERARGLIGAIDAPTYPLPDAGSALPVEKLAMSAVGGVLTAGEIGRGQNLDEVLRGAGASPGESLAFSRKLKEVFDPRKIRPGDGYRLWLDGDGRILRFTYQRSPVEIYEAVRAEDSWLPRAVDVPIERHEATAVGVLEGSLWESFTKAGASPDLIVGFVDLFSWDIDFAHESQPGDEFKVVYEVLYAKGEPIGNGRILAASYRDRDETHVAIHWESEHSKGYFDLDGNSTRKSFLRSPLRFTRISSGFSYSRRHPVTHKVKPHLGVDYAAPVGTPVWAVANATVTKVVRDKYNGRMVALRHAMGYETYYLHLSRFAKGIRRGAKVEQGQVIGYVGSSGTSTGPHLDYRIKKNGKWVNPLREKFKPGPPVPKEDLEAFKASSGVWASRLDSMTPRLDVAESH